MAEVASLASFTPPAPQDPGRYVLHFGDIRSGRIWGTLPASGASFSNALRDAGSFDVTIPPSTEADALDSICSGYTFAAVEWSRDFARRIVSGGPVWSDPDEDDLRLSGTGMFGMLSARILARDVPDAQLASSPPLIYSGMDVGSVMRSIVEQVLSMPDGELPIALEPVRPGTRSRPFFSYDLTPAAQRIRELADEANGPDFAMVPRFTDDNHTAVVWDLITGSEDAPQLGSRDPLLIDGTAPEQTLVGKVTGDRSATDQASHVFCRGAGQEVGSVIRTAADRTLMDAGWPRLDGVHGSESADPAMVRSAAAGRLAQICRPSQAVTVQVERSWWWEQGARLGDALRVDYIHKRRGLRSVTSRLLGESLDVSSPWVTLTLASTLAEDVV